VRLRLSRRNLLPRQRRNNRSKNPPLASKPQLHRRKPLQRRKLLRLQPNRK
jgi:hypothetical protein